MTLAGLRRPGPRGWHLIALALGSALTIFIYVRVQLRYDERPRIAPEMSDFVLHHAGPDKRFGWWGWADQGRYVDAALAWSHGVLDPAHHWYLPGYPLLGALFTRLTPVQPFVIPDLLCLLASLVLFSLLARRLAPTLPYAGAIGAVVFVLCAAVQPRSATVWAIPWTSTPEVPLILAALLAGADFMTRPRPLTAFLAALTAVAIIGFRPADAACVTIVVGLAMLSALGSARPGWREVARYAGAALTGAAIPVVVFGAAHVAVHGWTPGGYVVQSGRIGFDWRLLPLRWVTVMIDPRPLFPIGQGLAQRFWWIMPGMAGMLACLIAPGVRVRRLHLCVAALVAAELAMILSYRDLHPAGLWKYENHHYFKWMVPLFGFYGVLLLRALTTPRLMLSAGMSVAVVFAGLFMWRVDLTDYRPLPVTHEGGVVRISLPAGWPRVREAIVAPLSGSWRDIYFGRHALETDGRSYEGDSDFKATPRDGDTLIQPLRPMGTAPAVLTLAPGIRIEDGAGAPMMARQRLTWGLPCWFGLNHCRVTLPIDAPGVR
jgi:hypothetical protein